MEREEYSVSNRILTCIVSVLAFLVLVISFVKTTKMPEESPLGNIISFSARPVAYEPGVVYEPLRVSDTEGFSCLISPAWISMVGGSMFIYESEEIKFGQRIVRVHWLGDSTSPYRDCGKDARLVMSYGDAMTLAEISGGWMINGERRPASPHPIAPPDSSSL